MGKKKATKTIKKQPTKHKVIHKPGRKTKNICFKMVTRVKHEEKICKFCDHFTSNASKICDSCSQEFSDYDY